MQLLRRNRRLRSSETIRSLIREHRITPNDFIVPIFVIEGKHIKEEIDAMPGYFRFSLDLLSQEVRELWTMGLKAVLIFAKVEDHLKDNKGAEALNPDGLMQRAIKQIKEAVPEMLVMTDVALDPYSSYGHDGIIANGRVDNDTSVNALAKMALSHAKVGADFVAPSDMMDGRIKEIRKALEEANYKETGIMSYSAKYASSFYGPFRNALDSAPVDMPDVVKDKKTYQMDFGNAKEAIEETLTDIKEGADIVMVKPGLCYLDIVKSISDVVEVPIAVYQVSGEYAMLKAAAEKGWLDHDAVMIEQLTAIKRAGASLIASYFAKDAIQILE